MVPAGEAFLLYMERDAGGGNGMMFLLSLFLAGCISANGWKTLT